MGTTKKYTAFVSIRRCITFCVAFSLYVGVKVGVKCFGLNILYRTLGMQFIFFNTSIV